MLKTALAIRHVAFEDLGTLEPVLLARGYSIRYVDLGLDDLSLFDPLRPDLVVILGGPVGVYEQAEYPFLAGEIAWIGQRLAGKRAMLGLCLGAQLMAAATGARVYPGGQGKEIGWEALTLTAAADQYPFMSLLVQPLLHWHGDTFDLPAGAVLLAGTARYPHQVYALPNAIGFQCHPEVTVQGLERWFVGHACEIAVTPGISVPELRRQTAAHGPALESLAARFWPPLLDRIGA